MWGLPLSVDINGEVYHITNSCDYRVVLDCFKVFSSEELNVQQKIYSALYIFYEEYISPKDASEAINKMFEIINYGRNKSEETEQDLECTMPGMDWEYDWHLIAPAVSHKLGYEIRDENRTTHWYTFLGAYRELEGTTFNKVVNLRTKIRTGAKLDENDRAFLNANRKLIYIPSRLSLEDQEYLESAF